jgi:hypothetical protein
MEHAQMMAAHHHREYLELLRAWNPSMAQASSAPQAATWGPILLALVPRALEFFETRSNAQREQLEALRREIASYREELSQLQEEDEEEPLGPEGEGENIDPSRPLSASEIAAKVWTSTSPEVQKLIVDKVMELPEKARETALDIMRAVVKS